jgi:hypothetical protein
MKSAVHMMSAVFAGVLPAIAHAADTDSRRVASASSIWTSMVSAKTATRSISR